VPRSLAASAISVEIWILSNVTEKSKFRLSEYP